MFKSWKSRAGAFTVSALMVAVPIVGFAGPAGAAGSGNSDAANACQQGGWQIRVRTDSTPFKNAGDCVSYAAQGGTLKVSSHLLCESYGGTFGNTDLVGVISFDTVLWSCNGWSDPDGGGITPRFLALGDACFADGGIAFEAEGETPRNSTCGTLA